MKARLYFAAVLFLCTRVCADLGLTQISQIPLNCTPDVKSHRCSPQPCFFGLTQIPQISLNLHA